MTRQLSTAQGGHLTRSSDRALALATHWALVAVVTAAALSACSPVRNVKITDRFAERDRTTTYRLHVVTAPLPAGDAKVGAMYSAMARRYVNDHRDYIVRKASAQAAMSQADCGDKIEAVLWLEPAVAVKGAEVQVAVRGELRRCTDWGVIWSAEVADRWPSNDDQLTALSAQYVAETGAVAKVHAAPAFRALRLLLDTLPLPKLVREEDIDEKIEL